MLRLGQVFSALNAAFGREVTTTVVKTVVQPLMDKYVQGNKNLVDERAALIRKLLKEM